MSWRNTLKALALKLLNLQTHLNPELSCSVPRIAMIPFIRDVNYLQNYVLTSAVQGHTRTQGIKSYSAAFRKQIIELKGGYQAWVTA